MSNTAVAIRHWPGSDWGEHSTGDSPRPPAAP